MYAGALGAGATVTGVLKGYDQLMNLVLDETVEYLRGRWRSRLATLPPECYDVRALTCAGRLPQIRRTLCVSRTTRGPWG